MSEHPCVGAPTHRYVWGNNPLRAQMKGRPCVVVARSGYGAPRSVLVDFTDGLLPESAVVSPRALRRLRSKEAES